MPLGPKEILPLAKEILTYSQIPVIVQPNAGLPKEIKGQTIFDVDPVEFAKYIKEMAQLVLLSLVVAVEQPPNILEP